LIFLVRHAHAGSRSAWEERDDERPLSERGVLQAKLLAERMAAGGATVVVSSPYRRCVQTVEPLAALLGVSVETTEDLAEGAGSREAADLMATAPAGMVLCSHGDVLQDLVWRLAALGAPVDPRLPFQKGGLLLLSRDGSSITGASYEPPPA
jgi:8-oxo-dGTP diphosphatase